MGQWEAYRMTPVPECCNKFTDDRACDVLKAIVNHSKPSHPMDGINSVNVSININHQDMSGLLFFYQHYSNIRSHLLVGAQGSQVIKGVQWEFQDPKMEVR